jgi:ATP-dependent Clp protease adaptor protein ClpS
MKSSFGSTAITAGGSRRPAAAPVRIAMGPEAPPAEPGTEIIPDEEIDESLDQPWHVIIYDDPVNLMSYVTMVIQRVFGYPPGTAERMMMEVHTRGKSIVWTGGRERAEHYVQQIQSWQLLAAMKKAG